VAKHFVAVSRSQKVSEFGIARELFGFWTGWAGRYSMDRIGLSTMLAVGPKLRHAGASTRWRDFRTPVSNLG